MEGSLVFLEQVKSSDSGQFKITDILGFTVASIHLEVLRKDGDGAEEEWLTNGLNEIPSRTKIIVL